MKQLLAGILHMHTKGFAHRDLKCGNILLDSEYNVKIVDMGFSTRVAGRYGTGYTNTRVGTIGHMAPEIHEGKPYKGTEVDLFAIGVVMFILYCGYPPFDMADPKDAYYSSLMTGQSSSFWKTHQTH